MNHFSPPHKIYLHKNAELISNAWFLKFPRIHQTTIFTVSSIADLAEEPQNDEEEQPTHQFASPSRDESPLNVTWLPSNKWAPLVEWVVFQEFFFCAINGSRVGRTLIHDQDECARCADDLEFQTMIQSTRSANQRMWTKVNLRHRSAVKSGLSHSPFFLHLSVE